MPHLVELPRKPAFRANLARFTPCRAFGWMGMCTIPNQSVPMAYKEFDDAGRMRPSAYDRVVDVMEELYKMTLLMRGRTDYLSDRYSERNERARRSTGRLKNCRWRSTESADGCKRLQIRQCTLDGSDVVLPPNPNPPASKIDLDLQRRIDLPDCRLQTINAQHAAQARHGILDHDRSKRDEYEIERNPSNNGKVNRIRKPVRQPSPGAGSPNS